MLYGWAERKTTFLTDLFIMVPIPGTILGALSPSALAAYHWVLGKYTIDSWFLFIPVW